MVSALHEQCLLMSMLRHSGRSLDRRSVQRCLSQKRLSPFLKLDRKEAISKSKRTIRSFCGQNLQMFNVEASKY